MLRQLFENFQQDLKLLVAANQQMSAASLKQNENSDLLNLELKKVNSVQVSNQSLLSQQLEILTASDKALENKIDVQMDRLSELNNATQQLNTQTSKQQLMLGSLQQDLKSISVVNQQINATSLKQNNDLVSLNQEIHELKKSNLEQVNHHITSVQALNEMQKILQVLQDERLAQQQVLQQVNQSIIALSKPWWKKIF
jgi:hypothetical protein